ncbi:TolC family protein [Myroides odoratimimus]|uniref:Transporter n=2 Tax=Myroides odoratimimus TaxID=76832 RepID=A0A0U3G9R5_9FLAO|nr:MULTISPECIES: TolC family protein [Myroides]ALU26869.1 transporter [Myroides odoratimimus]EHO07761.1 hypothetical protein HMPREF9712_02497 [Myroides odoratimimus CCUG 10230]EHO11466.1 hypothetical protein HMPREF9714_01360 [Myroides odoratimimus CCUG 12901]MCA4793241.1 TolC family protein [Myroides odoratimimus]MCA4808008.1 TolC family protein [Myroides odoratimimus]
MKQNNFLYLIVFLLIIGQKALPQSITDDKNTFDLDRIWELTQKNHKKIKAIQLNEKAQQENIKNTKASQLPTINLQGSYSRLSDMPLYEDGFLNKPTTVRINSTNYSSMLATDVILYNGLSKNREIKIQEVALASIHSLLQLSLAEVKLESTKLFYTLIRHTHYKDLVEKEIKQDNKQLAEINSLYKNGTILKSDVLRSEVTLSNHQMLLTEIENNILIIQQQLNLLMGRDELAPLTPLYKDLKEEINLESSYESYLEKALQNAYELQIADNDIQRSELDLKQLQAKILPKVSLFADYSFNYPQSKAYPYADALYGMGQIGLKLNIPISNLYHTKHQKISQQSFISKQKVEREQKVDQLKNELRASYVKYTETLQRISVAEKNIKQTTETLRIIRNSYFNQQSLLTDLLDAETQLLQAQFDLTTAEINAKIEYYQIQKVIGNL